ncbi:MAG: efflux RND transporter periplasmic adaptor subunit [Planctomycetota bacterium]
MINAYRLLTVSLLVAVIPPPSTSAIDPIIPYGIARPRQHVEVAPRMPGVLVSLHVSPGQSVNAGEIIGVIDDAVAKATVRAALAAAERTAEIEQARHRLDFAERQHQRYELIKHGNAIAEVEYDNAATQLNEARAGLASAIEKQLQAQRNLELEQAKLERHNIRAPFDGQVLKVHRQQGASLSQEDSLVTLVNTRQLQLELYLPRTTVESLRTGQEYNVEAMAPIEKLVSARLQFVSPIIEPGTGSYRSIFLIENPKSSIPAGVKMRFVSSSKPGADRVRIPSKEKGHEH